MEMHAFYIDETEVSNADFAAYCAAAGCPAPEGAPDLPVVRVTIAQAREFAKWKGKRLPSLFEWERAARGTNGAKYPWGEADDAIEKTGQCRRSRHWFQSPVKSYAASRYPEYTNGRQRVGDGGGEVTFPARTQLGLRTLRRLLLTLLRPRLDEKMDRHSRRILQHSAQVRNRLGIQPGSGALLVERHRIPLREVGTMNTWDAERYQTRHSFT